MFYNIKNNNCQYALTILFISSLFVINVQAQPTTNVDILTTSTKSGIKLSLAWSNPIQAKYQHNETELLIEFTKPLGQLPISHIVKRHQQWIINIEYGYDTLLITLAPGVQANIESNHTVMNIFLSQQTAQDNDANSQPRSTINSISNDHIDYLHAIASLQSGETLTARNLLRELARKNPNNIDYMRDLALSEQRVGAWREAHLHYNHILQYNPGASDIAQAKRQLLREHGNHIRLNTTQYRAENQTDQAILQLNARFLLSPYWRIDSQIRNYQIRRNNTARNTIRQKTTIRDTAAMHVIYGRELQEHKLSLLSNAPIFGIGYRFAYGTLKKQISFSANYNEPVTRYLEGLLNYNARQGFAWHYQQNSKNYSSSISLLRHQYYTQRAIHIADTAGIRGNIDYRWLNTTALTLTTGYRLDAEYLIKSSPGPIDSKTKLLAWIPITKRETHAVYGILHHRLNTFFSYGFEIGFAKDRFHSQAPFISLQTKYRLNRYLETGATLHNSMAFDRGTNARIKQLTFYFTGYFL